MSNVGPARESLLFMSYVRQRLVFVKADGGVDGGVDRIGAIIILNATLSAMARTSPAPVARAAVKSAIASHFKPIHYLAAHSLYIRQQRFMPPC